MPTVHAALDVAGFLQLWEGPNNINEHEPPQEAVIGGTRRRYTGVAADSSRWARVEPLSPCTATHSLPNVHLADLRKSGVQNSDGIRPIDRLPRSHVQ